IVLRLWVPLIHSLRARNWNCPISGCALTASRVANRVGTSTPLSAGRVCVLVMVFSFGWWSMTTKQTLRSAPSRDLPDGRVPSWAEGRSAEGRARTLLAHGHVQ